MQELWENIINERKENTILMQRLETCSKMIEACLESNSTEKEKLELIKKVIRVSSEINDFRKTADIISDSANQFVLDNGKKLRNGNISLPREMKKKLRHEHLVPCSILANIIVSEKANDKAIYEVLLKNGIRAIITKEEDIKIDKMNLKSNMPLSWRLGDNPFIRYTESNVNKLSIKATKISP